MTPRDPPLPSTLAVALTFATLVGFVTGIGLTLAFMDAESVTRWRAERDACLDESPEA